MLVTLTAASVNMSCSSPSWFWQLRRVRLRRAFVAAALLACFNQFPGFVNSIARSRPVVVHQPTQRCRIALHADNIFGRFMRVTKANVKRVLGRWEDPERMLDQAVEEMQSDLIKVRQSYAEVLATQRRLASQKNQQEELAQDWYRRAELAVDKGEDDLAKEALTRRQAFLDKTASLQAQVDSMTANVERMFDSMKSLEDKIRQAKDEKEQLIARARTAKATSQVNEMLSDVGQNSAVGVFDRMKEKVEKLETQAEVSEGLLLSPTDSSMEDKFKALETGNKVDDELALLKGARSLPPATSSIDKELEEMRRKMKEA